MKAEGKDEELEALRAQLAKSAAAMEEASTLRADVEDLRRAAELERESTQRAASEARQEADVIKQLRYCCTACCTYIGNVNSIGVFICARVRACVCVGVDVCGCGCVCSRVVIRVVGISYVLLLAVFPAE